MACHAVVITGAVQQVLLRASPWLQRVARLRHKPGLVALGLFLRQVPYEPVKIGLLCFVKFAGVPMPRPALLRGPGSVRSATVNDIDALVQLRDKRSSFVDRFARGDRCVVGVVDDAIVGYEWFCNQPVHFETVWKYRIRVPSGWIYAYDAFIHPRYRNSGLWLRFKAHLGTLMKDGGQTGVLAMVEYGNWPSLRTHLRFGFQSGKTVLVVRVFGRTLLAHESKPTSAARKILASGLPSAHRTGN